MFLTHINSNVPQNIKRHTFFANLKVKLFNVLCHDVIREVQDKIPQPMSTSNLLNTRGVGGKIKMDIKVKI